MGERKIRRRTVAAIALGAVVAGLLVLAAPAAQANERGTAGAQLGEQVRSYVIGRGELAAAATCWRSTSITWIVESLLGVDLYKVTMKPVTWCGAGGKITSVTYTKGTQSVIAPLWGFDRWLSHGKVGGCVGCASIEYREDAQFKLVTGAGTAYGNAYVNATFYPDGRYAGVKGGR